MAISIEPAQDRHLPAILAIHNDAVLTTTAIWDAPARLTAAMT